MPTLSQKMQIPTVSVVPPPTGTSCIIASNFPDSRQAAAAEPSGSPVYSSSSCPPRFTVTVPAQLLHGLCTDAVSNNSYQTGGGNRCLASFPGVNEGFPRASCPPDFPRPRRKCSMFASLFQPSRRWANLSVNTTHPLLHILAQKGQSGLVSKPRPGDF